MADMRPKRWWILAVSLAFVGCSSSSGQAVEVTAQPTTSASAVFDDGDGQPETTQASEIAESIASISPLEPFDENPTTTIDEESTSAYISRVAMSATSIELTWSHNNAAKYHLHRVPWSSEVEPDPAVMTADNEIHVADDIGRFVDAEVTAGVRYWYGVRALSPDGAQVGHGWHRADAVTDTEPPAAAEPVSAKADQNGVLVAWTRPEENYELHGYRVLRSVNGGEPDSMATTYDLEQTSFIDDRPPTSGTVTYSIVAFDFHWNESIPAEITIDR